MQRDRQQLEGERRLLMEREIVSLRAQLAAARSPGRPRSQGFLVTPYSPLSIALVAHFYNGS